MEEKLIYYKVKPEYVKYAINLVESESSTKAWLTSYSNFTNDGDWYSVFKAAGVLDLWFDIVKGEEEFKAGDFVVITSLGNAESKYFTVGKTYCLSENFYEYADSFYVVGNNSGDMNGWSSRAWELGIRVRKATSEEILEYLINKLKEDKDIEVGSTIIAPNKIEGKHCWNSKENRWENSWAIGNRIVNGFILHSDNKTLLMQVSGTAPSIYYNAFEMVLANKKPNITINGYKAKFSDYGVAFGCQSYSKDFVIQLAKCLLTNNFKMDHKDKIIEIAEYFNNEK